MALLLFLLRLLLLSVGCEVAIGLMVGSIRSEGLVRWRRAFEHGCSTGDDIFGKEFVPEQPPSQAELEEGPIYFKATKTEADLEPVRYWKGKPYRQLPRRDRGKVMKSFDNLRATFLADSIFVSACGICLVWQFGVWRDVKSFALGSALGLLYAILLGRYVEGIGGQQKGGGSARFAPVILLVALYGKYRTELSIIPELLGFFTYQVASFLQIFNSDLYQEEDEEEGKKTQDQ